MKASEVIGRADRLRPNTHDESDKRMWLLQVEKHVADHMNLHMGDEAVPGDLMDMDADPVMLLDGADTQVYVLYLMAMYDYYNGDIDRYNPGAQVFGEAMSDWRAAYRRSHMPKPTQGKWVEV